MEESEVEEAGKFGGTDVLNEGKVKQPIDTSVGPRRKHEGAV